MQTPAVHIRFVGLLASTPAEVLARACIGRLATMYGDIARWDVCLQPPVPPWVSSGYAVRAQARLQDGSVLAIRAQGEALEATVCDAFDGIEELLRQENGGAGAPRVAWPPTLGGHPQPLIA